jgi:NADH-quinone oxidoreductase subunit F
MENVYNFLKKFKSKKGYLSEKDLELISKKCHLPKSFVYGIISFYKDVKHPVLKSIRLLKPFPYYSVLLKKYIKNIGEYERIGGFFGLRKVLRDFSSQQVIDVIKESNLRGRGGMGFPTGLKWEFTAKSISDEKYIIANGEEGEPGTFKDVTLLNFNPYSLLEGMIIAGYAIGAKKGFIFIKPYPEDVSKRVKNAIKEVERIGFLGDNILGTKFSFSIELKNEVSAYICGEESAQIETIEGKRPIPRQRPPFPSVKGLFGKPTNINNIETYANVPYIINGEFKNTKLFCITGTYIKPSLVELPIGVKIKEVIKIVTNGKKKIKSVLIGGPSGGFVIHKYFNLPLDYESLNKIGAMLGSGSIRLVYKEDNIVNICFELMKFFADESCGKCTPCRVGTVRMKEMLENILSGKKENLNNIIELGEVMRDTSFCGLGQAAPNAVLSAITNFKKEFL